MWLTYWTADICQYRKCYDDFEEIIFKYFI